jgi:hypothetical protein
MKVKSLKGTVAHLPGDIAQFLVDAGIAEKVDPYQQPPVEKRIPRTTWWLDTGSVTADTAPGIKTPTPLVMAACASCSQTRSFSGPNAMQQKFSHCGITELPPADLQKRRRVEPPALYTAPRPADFVHPHVDNDEGGWVL